MRLGAANGISDGSVARIYFVPQVVIEETTLRISNVILADSSGETYTASLVDGVEVIEIMPAQLFLPAVLR